jgi:transcriptional regulator with XRE-family HTH domain
MAQLADARAVQQRMGERLRVARQERRLSLRDLAERLGVSASLISQIETGRANPSVSTLYALVAELDVSLDELLFGDRRGSMSGTPARPDAASIERLLQRREARTAIRLASGVTWERLTPTSEPGTEFLFVTYDVGGASSVDGFQRHDGHEWGYVLEGTLDVRIGFDDFVLRPGDAISFDSTTPHRLSNSGPVPVRAVWFVSGRSIGEGLGGG